MPITVLVVDDHPGFRALAEALAVGDERPAVVMTSGRDRGDFEALLGTSVACGFIPKERLSASALEELLR